MELIYSGDQILFNEVFILPPYSLFLYGLMPRACRAPLPILKCFWNH